MQPIKIGELATKTGLTVRTLHYYHEIGLLVPSQRTESGHRLYATQDIMKLQQILSLQSLGLSLIEIQDVINEPEQTLEKVLKLHRDEVEKEVENKQKLFLRLERMLTQLSHSQTVQLDEILSLIEVTVMYEKYYTPEQLEYLKSREASYTKEKQREVEQAWAAVFADINKAYQQGLSVDSPEVIRIGAIANGLIHEFTGDRRDVKESLQNMYKDDGAATLMQHGVDIDQDAFDFLKKAMGQASLKS